MEDGADSPWKQGREKSNLQTVMPLVGLQIGEDLDE